MPGDKAADAEQCRDGACEMSLLGIIGLLALAIVIEELAAAPSAPARLRQGWAATRSE